MVTEEEKQANYAGYIKRVLDVEENPYIEALP